MSDLVTTLRSELQSVAAQARRLEKEVNDAQTRLRGVLEKSEKIRALLSLYDHAATDSFAAAQPKLEGIVEAPRDSVSMPVLSAIKGKTKKAQMEDAITELLRLHGTVHRVDILLHLKMRKIMNGESNPLAQLAAFLSGSRDKFHADGRGNFTLVKSRQTEPSPASKNDAGSAGVVEAVQTGPAPATGEVEERRPAWASNPSGQ